MKYVEKAGTGITDMVADCREAGLPEPEFRQCGPHFVTTLWRDWLTEEVVERMGLNERQKKAVSQVKINGLITNSEYQQLVGVTRKTAMRDLAELANRHVLELVGSRRGAHYIIAKEQK